MPDSRNQRTAPSAAWESFRRHTRATFNSGQPRSEATPKISIRGKGHMKLIFTALIALCTVAATFADERQVWPCLGRSHNYKVVDGQLVDLGPAPTMTPTPSPTPAQPTIIIDNNIINATPTPTRPRRLLRLPRNSRVARYQSNRGTSSSIYGRTIATTTPSGLLPSRKTD